MSLNLYIHISMYVGRHAWVCIFVHISIYVCTWMYVGKHVSVFTDLYVYM